MIDHTSSYENRVRERAYHLWQEAGAPAGREDEFWHRAREIESETINNEAEPETTKIEPTDPVEEAGGHYPPTGDTQNFA